MTEQALTVFDTPELVEGEPGHAWTWDLPEPGCPMLDRSSQKQTAAAAAQPREIPS